MGWPLATATEAEYTQQLKAVCANVHRLEQLLAKENKQPWEETQPEDDVNCSPQPLALPDLELRDSPSSLLFKSLASGPT